LQGISPPRAQSRSRGVQIAPNSACKTQNSMPRMETKTKTDSDGRLVNPLTQKNCTHIFNRKDKFEETSSRERRQEARKTRGSEFYEGTHGRRRRRGGSPLGYAAQEGREVMIKAREKKRGVRQAKAKETKLRGVARGPAARPLTARRTSKKK